VRFFRIGFRGVELKKAAESAVVSEIIVDQGESRVDHVAQLAQLLLARQKRSAFRSGHRRHRERSEAIQKIKAQVGRLWIATALRASR
jgi:hypothetical protein